MLTGLISSGSVYCVADARQKSAEISQFRPNFGIFGSSCAHPIDRSGPNLAEKKQTYGIRLHAKLYLNPFTESPSRAKKPQYWANFDICGLLYPVPFTDEDEGQIRCGKAEP